MPNCFRNVDANPPPIPGTPGEDGYGSLAQGYLEVSNVDIVSEMVELITAQRAYEINSKAIEAADRLEPNLVLMDINMPGINGVEATRRIVADHPGTVVLLVSTYQADDLPDGADSCGAAAYVHKEDFSPTLLGSLWEQHRPTP